MKRLFHKVLKQVFIISTLLCCFHRSQAYSVLTHEAIIDVTWDSYLKPALLKRYPTTTPDELKDAQAYAYGGAVAPDMGYYPFGSKLFTNLVHYVRSGDFVDALLRDEKNVNEYAFALGVMCHYYADKYGHPMGTNRSVPLTYPKDKDQYGNYVTYEQDPVSHIRMEFGFDILQTARGNYASEKYHSFIGFKISQPLLDSAFVETYGMHLTDIFKDYPKAEGTFRWIVKNLFPTITRAAWANKKKDIKRANPGITRRKFEYKMQSANYNHEYGTKREKPGFFPGLLAKIVFVIPKVGPLKDLKIKVPGPDAEKLFIQSFDTVQARYTMALKSRTVKTIQLPDIDYDTGNETSPGEYNLADKSYNDLLLKLEDLRYKDVDSKLRQNILSFYANCNEKLAAKAGWDSWQKVTNALDTLKDYKPLTMQ